MNSTTERYEELYAPWLRDPDTLLRLGQYEPGEALLDLCGGSGAVSQAALDYRWGEKPDITLLDLNPRARGFWAETAKLQGCLKTVEGRAEDVGRILPQRRFGLVVIRQALGYLDLERTFHALSQVMEPGARLVFNSFIDPLAEGVKRYSYKTYRYENVRFAEAHFTALGRVIHLQARLWPWKPGADVTLFKYHPDGDIERALQPHFSCQRFQDGRSVRWLCIRQPYSHKERYEEMLLELAEIRERHDGEESAEEDDHLNEMDRVYHLCSGWAREQLAAPEDL